MDPRLIAIGAASLIGLVAGGGLWALSGGRAQGQALDGLDARLTTIATRTRAHSGPPNDALAQILAVPLFVSSAPAEGFADVQVQLFGVARSPSRIAALISIGGAPAEWLAVGEARAGVAVRSVSGSSVTIATPLGEREVMLGGGLPTTGAPVASSGPPPGFKSPPPPASAPGMTQ